MIAPGPWYHFKKLATELHVAGPAGYHVGDLLLLLLCREEQMIFAASVFKPQSQSICCRSFFYWSALCILAPGVQIRGKTGWPTNVALSWLTSRRAPELSGLCIKRSLHTSANSELGQFINWSAVCPHEHKGSIASVHHPLRIFWAVP